MNLGNRAADARPGRDDICALNRREHSLQILDHALLDVEFLRADKARKETKEKSHYQSCHGHSARTGGPGANAHSTHITTTPERVSR